MHFEKVWTRLLVQTDNIKPHYNSALLAFCEDNPPVIRSFTSYRTDPAERISTPCDVGLFPLTDHTREIMMS